MKHEMEAHLKTGTFELVSPDEIKTREGSDTHFIDSVWKYRIKTQDGIITIYKSQLCVNGMFMRCDFLDTFAPVS